MKESSGGRRGRRFGGRRRPPFGNHDSVDPGTVRRSQDGAQVPGILDLIEGEEELRLRRFLEEVIKLPPLEARELRNDPLVLAAEAPEPLARLPVDGDPVGPREGRDLPGARIELSFGENDLPDAPGRGLEGFPDGVEPLYGLQDCQGTATVTTAWTAIPSPLPVNPIPSVVVAFRPTSACGIPSRPASLARIEAM